MVTAHCKDCSEYLCDNCVRAHQRVRITKDHRIISFIEEAAMMQSKTTSATGTLTASPVTSVSPLTAMADKTASA